MHRELEYEDVWAMFGEGRHPHIERLYETKLAPFLSQSANHFWQSRLWYFKQGLYYQGGMVRALLMQCIHEIDCTTYQVPMEVLR